MVAFSRSPGFRLPRTPTSMSAFSTLVTNERLLELLAGSLTARRADWTHPTDYAQTQALADVARTLNSGAIRVPSARLEGAVNIAVLAPAALSPNVRPHSSWALLVTRDGLLAIRELSDQTMRFSTPEF